MNKKEGMMRIIKLNILILMLFIIVLSSFTVFAKDVVVKGGELTLQENFIVNNSNFFVNISNARVGIGTAAPTQILDVRGNITTTGILGVGSSSIILSNQNDLYNTETLQIYSNISDATNRRGYIGIRNDGLLQSGIEFVENNSGVLGELIRFRINNGAETAILNVTGFNLLTGANLTTQGDIFISGNSVKTWLYNQTTPANTFTTSQGYITSAVGNSTYIKLGATDSVRIKYQNITNIPTCTANQRLTFDGTTLSCSDIGASASSPWSYNATTIYNDTSGVKIGIGTVNPISLFDVKGTTTITGSGVPGGSGSLELQYANGIGEILAYNRSANAWLSLRLRGNPIKLYGESGDKGIDITSAGNVGIGTTTPQNLLNIITTSTGYVDLVNVSTTVDPQAGATRLLVSNPKGAVYLSQYGSGAPGKLGNNSAVFSISTNLILHASDGIIFGLPSPYTTPKMFLNTSSGNLGIGTTTPTQALHVVGSINTTGDIWILGDDINRGLSASAAPATTLSKGFNGIGTAGAGGQSELSTGGSTSGAGTTGGNGGASIISNAGDGGDYGGDGGSVYISGGGAGDTTGGNAGTVYIGWGGTGATYGNDGVVNIGNPSGKKNAILTVNGDIKGNYTSVDGSRGMTNTTGFWMCKDSGCTNKCQVQIKNGLIIGCT